MKDATPLVIAAILLAFGFGLAAMERHYRQPDTPAPCCYPGATSCYDDPRWGLLRPCAEPR